MERTRLLTYAVVGLLILNLLTIGFLVLKSGVFSDDAPRRPPIEGPARLIIERLHFDEQQQRLYLDMARRHHRQTRQLNEESVRLFQAYYGLLTAPPDLAGADSLTDLIADNQRRLAALNFAHFRQIKALCRPEQQARFSRLVADLAQLFGKPQRPPGGRPPVGPPENFPARP